MMHTIFVSLVMLVDYTVFRLSLLGIHSVYSVALAAARLTGIKGGSSVACLFE